MPSHLAVIIDNSVTSRKILERLTISLGSILVRSFADAEHALSFCRECRPRFVIVGELEGGGPPAEFIRELQLVTTAAELPVLLVASPEDPDAIERARDAGASDHLLAPVDHREFRLRARQLLSRSERSRRGGGAELLSSRRGGGAIGVTIRSRCSRKLLTLCRP